MKKVILTTCLIATVLMNFTSGYTSNMTAKADYETPIVAEGAYTSTVEDTIEETTTPIETAPTEVQTTETQNTESVETTSAEVTEATETTTTEIQTTEPIETTVVEETTITSIAETTTTETTTYIVGDADENGKLNVRDAAFIAKALANKEADTLPKSADYTEDNKIDVRDAAAIARHLASRYSDDEEPVVTSVSNDISVGVTTSTHIAHYRPTESCTCVIDEDTILCPLCSIPMDCTCGLDVTTTSTSNEDETTTTTAVGNDDDTTTTQTAETTNTLSVETTVATTNTTTIVTESTTTTTTTVPISATEVEVTEDPRTTTTMAITTAASDTAHYHKYEVETEVIEHEAEYQTKTIWMYAPQMYHYIGLNNVIPDGENRYYPNPEESLAFYENPTEIYEHVHTYDMLCHFFGSWDSLVEQYRGNRDYFSIYIDKSNFADYKFTEEQWYDSEYMQNTPIYNKSLFSDEWVYAGSIGEYDCWGNKMPEFNPELDSIVAINYKWESQTVRMANRYEEFGSGNSMRASESFIPVAQETVLVEDAWTEIVTHEVCECGHVKE